jgi:nicotinamidase-related amidase
MKRNGTLVIVDMQPEFAAVNNPSLLSAVIRKIRLAKMLNYGIVIVEYGKADQFQEWTGGDTHLRIVKELDGYRHKTFVVKHVDDGSPQVMEAIEHYKFNRRHIYVCGVNTCCCVYATVAGLAKRLPEAAVYIQSDACRCGCDCEVRYHVTALRHQYNNVCLAPETRGEFDEYHKPRAFS